MDLVFDALSSRADEETACIRTIGEDLHLKVICWYGMVWYGMGAKDDDEIGGVQPVQVALRRRFCFNCCLLFRCVN